MSKKYDSEFMKLLQKHATLNEATGNLKFAGMYASVHIDISFDGTVVSTPHSHVVWFLKHGRWPAEGMYLDHINDDPMDNCPSNLREVTHAENMEKRRGRSVNRNYGSGKYGFGLNVYSDRRDGRHYVTRTLSRGHHGQMKTIKKSVGGYATLAEAEERIKHYIAEIEKHGPDHMPAPDEKKESKHAIRLKAETPRIRSLRKRGHTMHEIAEMTGFCEATIHKVTTDMGIDRRKG
jgi:hypothetical protein